MPCRKIIIIGASSGIGRTLACIYAGAGHRVVVTGRRLSLLEEIVAQYPGQVSAVYLDVLEPENGKKIRTLIEELGGLDLLICNAGYGDASMKLQWEIEDLTTRTNVNGFLSIVHEAFNYFIEQGCGQIALTSSVAALRGNSWSPAYSASKAYISRYAEGLNLKARRLKKDIVITDIRPGFVDTKMSKGNGRFWIAPVEKAALQMVRAIDKKKRVVYITRRWWLVAQAMKLLPFWLYRRMG